MNKQKSILDGYRNIIESIKSGVSRDLVEATSTGAINIDGVELPRVLALLETLIDLYAANGYEQMQRLTVTTTRKKR